MMPELAVRLSALRDGPRRESVRSLEAASALGVENVIPRVEAVKRDLDLMRFRTG